MSDEKLVRWRFNNDRIPFMEKEDGVLYTTSSVLCDVLGVAPQVLDNLFHRNKDQFEGLSLMKSGSKDFLDAHRAEFRIRRLRSDLRLWSEDDVLIMVFLSRSEDSRRLRREFMDFIKQNVTRDYVTREEWLQLHDELAELRASRDMALPSLQQAASAAGVALNAQKGTRHLRLVK